MNEQRGTAAGNAPARGAARAPGRVGRARAGLSAGPLAVLFSLNLVDEFDRIAFATLAPEIRDDFGLSDGALVAIASTSTALAILLAVPIGYLADRFDRARMSLVAAGLWAAAAIATGLAHVVFLLAAARFAAGTGRVVNDAVHPSLLADHYPVGALPRVTAIHRVASNIGAVVAGVVAGVLAARIGWRPTFVLMALPTLLVVAWGAVVLREPRAARRNDGSRQARAGFAQALRALARKRSLRRVWLLALLYGASFIPLLTTLLSILLDREYGVGPAGRGVAQSVYAIAAAGGLALGVVWARRALAREDPGRLMVPVAGFVATYAAGLALLAVVDSLAVTTGLVVLLGIGSYGYAPAYFTVIAQVVPSPIRSQGYAYSLFFFAVGGLLFSAVAAAVVDQFGVRAAVLTLAVLAGAAALVARSAAPLLRHEVEQDAPTG